MYDGPLSSCGAATCWRGERDAFKYFENKQTAKKILTHRFNRCKPSIGLSHKIDRLDLGPGFVLLYPRKAPDNTIIPDPNPMPIKDGLITNQILF